MDPADYVSLVFSQKNCFMPHFPRYFYEGRISASGLCITCLYRLAQGCSTESYGLQLSNGAIYGVWSWASRQRWAQWAVVSILGRMYLSNCSESPQTSKAVLRPKLWGSHQCQRFIIRVRPRLEPPPDVKYSSSRL